MNDAAAALSSIARPRVPPERLCRILGVTKQAISDYQARRKRPELVRMIALQMLFGDEFEPKSWLTKEEREELRGMIERGQQEIGGDLTAAGG